MNNIQINFSIKDLENLTGIKAHTIRIWEKRYGLLSPERSETNIRNYSISSLQKLSNIAYLNNNGVKISKIANLKEDEIPLKVKEIASKLNAENHFIETFKMAMLNFDQIAFYDTYNHLIETKTFEEIFYSVFLPLLDNIGLLWQTSTITPAHEHFISINIKQKILIHIEKLPLLKPNSESGAFVLFLPEHEIHNIGLMFINYELRKKGYHTIYLGESLPMENLTDLHAFFKHITFISYFTVKPETDAIYSYIEKFNDLLLNKEKSNLILLGPKIAELKNIKSFEKVQMHKSIKDFVDNI